MARLWRMRRARACACHPLPLVSLDTSSFSGWEDSMRSIGLLAVVTGTLVLASSCSKGTDLIEPENEAPVANFELPACTINESCEFVSTSTDDAGVTGWSWDHNGDNTPDANTATAAYTY